jgi:hypothetical protein
LIWFWIRGSGGCILRFILFLQSGLFWSSGGADFIRSFMRIEIRVVMITWVIGQAMTEADIQKGSSAAWLT